MATEVMIDIETLDTRESAVVLSIGAVAFDPRGNSVPEVTLHLHLDPEIQVRWGRTISPSTVLWWMKQDDAAREGITSAYLENPNGAIQELHQLIKDVNAVGVWGNGAMFDNAILVSLAASAGYPRPWNHKLDRCYRTLKGVANVDFPVFEGVEHNALHDAVFQAQHLQMIYKKLGL
jgi:hypothetical protein